MESDLFWVLLLTIREEVFNTRLHPPQKENATKCCIEEKREGTKEKLKWLFFFSFSVPLKGIFPSFVSSLTVFVIVIVNETLQLLPWLPVTGL